MNKYQKGFAPIVIALIIVFLAGAGGTSYYLINKQSKLLNNNIDTSDWKTYTNSDIGFEIKYPSNWKSPFENWGPGFTAGTSVDNNNLCVVDVMGWSESNDAEIADLIGKGYVKTSIKIDGIDAIRLTRNPAGAGLTEAIYFEINDKNFRIGRNRGFADKIEQDCIKNFNQIIVSFKFINEKINKNETVNWKTYNNEEYSFNFKYPAEYEVIKDTSYNIKYKIIGKNGFEQIIYIDSSNFSSSSRLKELFEGRPKIWISSKMITVNGYDAVEVLEDNYGKIIKEIYIGKDNLVIAFQFKLDSLESKISSERQSILDSFRFTEKNETSDWKTYKYEEYGFEIKYPQTWTSNISTMYELGALSISSPKENNGNFINFWINRYNLSEGGFGYPPETLSAPNTTIDGIKAYKDEGYVRNPDGPSTQSISFEKNGYIYILTFQVFKKYNLPSEYKYEDIKPAIFTPEEQIIWDEVISTFKFL